MRMPLGLALLLHFPVQAAQAPPQPVPSPEQPQAGHWLAQGRQQKQAGQYQAAMESFEKAAEAFTKARDPEAALGAQAECGVAAYMLGSFAKAAALWQPVLEGAAARGDWKTEADCLSNLSLAVDMLGDTTQAYLYIDRAITLFRAHGQPLKVAESLGNRGATRWEHGDWTGAEKDILESLAIYQAAGAPDTEQMEYLQGLGQVYCDLGDLDRALPLFDRALAAARKTGNGYVEGAVLNALGTLYDFLNASPKAIDYFAQALAIREKAGDVSGQATGHNNLAASYQKQDRWVEARSEYEKSLALSTGIGKKSGMASALANLARIDALEGLLPQARQRLETSLGLRRAMADRFGEGNCLASLGEISLKAGQPEEAMALLNQALGIQESLKDRARQVRTLGLIMKAQGDLGHLEQGINSGKAALGLLQSLRADMKGVPSELVRGFVVTYEPVFRGLADLLLQAGSMAEAHVVIRNLKDEEYRGFARQPLGALRSSGGADTGALAQPVPSVTPSLAKHLATLHYVVTENHVSLLVTTRQGQWTAQVALTEAELNRKVGAFRRLLQDPTQDPLPLAQELYRTLLGPAQAHLRSAHPRTLLFSMDGALRYLPMAALHDGRKFLAETYSLAMLTESAPPRLEQASRKPRRFMGLGVTRAWGDLPALPGVRQELAGILRQGGTGVLPGQILLDNDFTLHRLQGALRAGYPLLHLATHLKLIPGVEDQSFLLLGDGSHWTLREVREQAPDLSRVDLLTLSACETALSAGRDQNGKEVEGLATLALHCGARSVLAALWPVADRTNAPLIHHFYRFLGSSGRLSKGEALAKAQVALIHSSKCYRHPAYWANFVLMGDYR